MINSRNTIRRAAQGVFRGIRRGLQPRSRLWFKESPATEIELKGSRRPPVLELSLVRDLVARSNSVHGQLYFWSLTLRVLTLSSMGFKLVLRASVHRAEWNSAVHYSK